MSYFPEKLTTFEYYENLLPLYLRQSPGYKEHFRIMQEAIKNIVDVGDQILGSFNIFADDYVPNTDMLNLLGRIWGLPRDLAIHSEANSTMSITNPMQIASNESDLISFTPTSFTFNYDVTTSSVLYATVVDVGNESFTVGSAVNPTSWTIKANGNALTKSGTTFSGNGITVQATYNTTNSDVVVSGPKPIELLIEQIGTNTEQTVAVSGSWSSGSDYINIGGTDISYGLLSSNWRPNRFLTNTVQGTLFSTRTVTLGYRPYAIVFERKSYDEDVDDYVKVRTTYFSDWTHDEDYITFTSTGFNYYLNSTEWGDGWSIDPYFTAIQYNASGTYINPKYSATYLATSDQVVTMTLDDELYLLLLKVVISKAFFDGSRDALLKLYERLGLNITYKTVSNKAATVYLIADANTREEVKTLFKAGLLTIPSMGISYTYEVQE